MKTERCRACGGTGMLADDEGWQYRCSVCRGTGEGTMEREEAEIVAVDENNRLLD